MKAIVALVLAVLLPSAAFAHAQLLGAEPAADAVLEVAPSRIELQFNEPIASLSARWTGPDGATQDVVAQTQDTGLHVTPPEDLAEGTHVLSWRVVSADGHPVGGSHVLSIGQPSAVPVTEEASIAVPAAAGRLLLTLSMSLGVGALGFAHIARLRAPRLLRAATVMVVPAAIFLLGAQTIDLSGTGLTALGSGTAWHLAITGPFGLTAGLAVLAAGIALVRKTPLAGAAALLLGGASFAASGHAASAAAWAPLVVGLHTAAILYWAGALAVLPAHLRDAPSALQRFTPFAPVMIAVLTLSGAALTWVQLAPTGFSGSAYELILLAKLGLVLVLLGLAAVNRWHLTPRMDMPHAREQMARVIRWELVLIIGILALTAAFRLTPPPRSGGGSGVEVHVHGAQSGGDLLITPGRTGPNRIVFHPHAADMGPLDPMDVTFSFTLADQGLGPLVAQGVRESGPWFANVLLPAAGEWDVVITVLIDDFTQERLGAEIVVSE